MAKRKSKLTRELMDLVSKDPEELAILDAQADADLAAIEEATLEIEKRMSRLDAYRMRRGAMLQVFKDFYKLYWEAEDSELRAAILYEKKKLQKSLVAIRYRFQTGREIGSS